MTDLVQETWKRRRMLNST